MSSEQINSAQKEMPESKDLFRQGDMLDACLKAETGKYGGVVAMFSILHLIPS